MKKKRQPSAKYAEPFVRRESDGTKIIDTGIYRRRIPAKKKGKDRETPPPTFAERVEQVEQENKWLDSFTDDLCKIRDCVCDELRKHGVTITEHGLAKFEKWGPHGSYHGSDTPPPESDWNLLVRTGSELLSDIFHLHDWCRTDSTIAPSDTLRHSHRVAFGVGMLWERFKILRSGVEPLALSKRHHLLDTKAGGMANALSIEEKRDLLAKWNKMLKGHNKKAQAMRRLGIPRTTYYRYEKEVQETYSQR